MLIFLDIAVDCDFFRTLISLFDHPEHINIWLNQWSEVGGGTISLTAQWQTEGVLRKPVWKQSWQMRLFSLAFAAHGDVEDQSLVKHDGCVYSRECVADNGDVCLRFLQLPRERRGGDERGWRAAAGQNGATFRPAAGGWRGDGQLQPGESRGARLLVRRRDHVPQRRLTHKQRDPRQDSAGVTTRTHGWPPK